MDPLNTEFPLHPVGYSGAKQEFKRSGVKQGNFAEEVLARDYAGAPGFPLQTGKPFAGDSVTRSTYKPVTGEALAAGAQRVDLVTKYVKFGTSAGLPVESGVACWATTSQLAYAGVGVGGEGGEQQRKKIQDCLWKVPLSLGVRERSDALRAAVQAEAAADPWTTVEKDSLARVAQDPERAQARPPLAQPQDPKGEAAQVGRKAAGEFRSHFDRDFVRIGLRGRKM
eukprot:scaffold2.g7050.t1